MSHIGERPFSAPPTPNRPAPALVRYRKGNPVTTQAPGPVISVMLAVADATAAIAWYQHALGATVLWDLGGVAGLEIDGAPLFVGEPANNGWESPTKIGITSTRIEVFCDDPDAFIARAIRAGADGDFDQIRDHQMPWGAHRQGGFRDPFGHIWLVGDRSPLSRHAHEPSP